VADPLPRFGGTNGVTDLDIGQANSARRVAGTAEATVSVVPGGPETAEVENQLPQQDITYADVQGTTGRRVIWHTQIKTTSLGVMADIMGELEQKKTGFNGKTKLYDPTQMHSTQMEDAHETPYGRMRLVDIRPTSRQFALGGGGQVRTLQLVFDELGEAVG